MVKNAGRTVMQKTPEHHGCKDVGAVPGVGPSASSMEEDDLLRRFLGEKEVMERGMVERLFRKFPDRLADRARIEQLLEKPWWPADLNPEAPPTGGTLLSQDWLEWLVRTYPETLYGRSLRELAAELFTGHQVIAEVLIAKDRRRGIEHPEMQGRMRGQRCADRDLPSPARLAGILRGIRDSLFDLLVYSPLSHQGP